MTTDNYFCAMCKAADCMCAGGLMAAGRQTCTGEKNCMQDGCSYTSKHRSVKETAMTETGEQQPEAGAFDYSGYEQHTLDVLHDAENIIRNARKDFIVSVAVAVDMVHRELVHNVNGQNNQYSENSFSEWCASVGIKKTTAYKLLQTAALFDGATPDESEILSAAPASLLYEAARPSAPPQLVAEVKAGEITTHKEWQDKLAAMQRERDAAIDKIKARDAELAKEKDLSDNYMQRFIAEQDRANELTEKVKELEARPVEVVGAGPEDIEKWKREGADELRDALTKEKADAAYARYQLSEAQKKIDKLNATLKGKEDHLQSEIKDGERAAHKITELRHEIDVLRAKLPPEAAEGDGPLRCIPCEDCVYRQECIGIDFNDDDLNDKFDDFYGRDRKFGCTFGKKKEE